MNYSAKNGFFLLSGSDKNVKLLAVTTKNLTISKLTNLRVVVPKISKGIKLQVFVKNSKGVTYKAVSLVTKKTGKYTSTGIRFSKPGKYLIMTVISGKIRTTQVIVK